jgi:hypothetical protein
MDWRAGDFSRTAAGDKCIASARTIPIYSISIEEMMAARCKSPPAIFVRHQGSAWNVAA